MLHFPHTNWFLWIFNLKTNYKAFFFSFQLTQWLAGFQKFITWALGLILSLSPARILQIVEGLRLLPMLFVQHCFYTCRYKDLEQFYFGEMSYFVIISLICQIHACNQDNYVKRVCYHFDPLSVMIVPFGYCNLKIRKKKNWKVQWTF